MAQYCTVQDVSNELNGLTIDASSTPSSATVDEWITQESEWLENKTGRMWGSATLTNEYHDYDGSGYLSTDYAPIISISSASYEENGLNGSEESWVALTEGRTSAGDYITYKPEGQLQFHGNTKPIRGFQNFRITYVAGYAKTNVFATSIVSKRVALRVISTVVNASSSEQGGSISVGAISISDPSTFSLDTVKSLNQQIKDDINNLGSFRTHRYNRRWD